MSNLIISKKSIIPAANIIFTILGAIITVLNIYTSGFDADFGSEVEFHEVVSFASPFVLLVVTAFMLGSSLRYNKSYINIYNDHIEGYGVCGKFGNTAQSFNLSQRDFYTITREGSYICINCNGKNYYLCFSDADANQIYQTAVNLKNSGARNAEYSYIPPQGDRVYTCPRCRANCRVPQVRGTIRITCPKCRSSFTVNN